MKNIIYFLLLAFVPVIVCRPKRSGSSEPSEEIIWDIPFEKSHVNYHRSSICMTIKGVTHCLSKNLKPGNPQVVSDMFRILEMHSNLPSYSALKGPPAGENPGAGEDAVEAVDKTEPDTERIETKVDDDVVNAEKPQQEQPAQEPLEQDRAADIDQKNAQEENDQEQSTPAELPDPVQEADAAADEKSRLLLRAIDYSDNIKQWGASPDETRYRRVMRAN